MKVIVNGCSYQVWILRSTLRMTNEETYKLTNKNTALFARYLHHIFEKKEVGYTVKNNMNL